MAVLCLTIKYEIENIEHTLANKNGIKERNEKTRWI